MRLIKWSRRWLISKRGLFPSELRHSHLTPRTCPSQPYSTHSAPPRSAPPHPCSACPSPITPIACHPFASCLILTRRRSHPGHLRKYVRYDHVMPATQTPMHHPISQSASPPAPHAQLVCPTRFPSLPQATAILGTGSTHARVFPPYRARILRIDLS